jgi:hypothetical protein
LLGVVTHVGQVFDFKKKKKELLGFEVFIWILIWELLGVGVYNFIFQGMNNGWVFHYCVRRVFERFFDKHLINTLSRLSPKFLKIPNLNSRFPTFLRLSPSFFIIYPILVQGSIFFELKPNEKKI